MQGRLFARLVTEPDVPLCMVEAELHKRGAHVTRLLAANLLPGLDIDASTFRLLGMLYDGLIVPHADNVSASAISMAAGVPVVLDDQDASALSS